MNREFWTLTFPPAGAGAEVAAAAERQGWDGVQLADSQNLTGDVYATLTAAALATDRILLAPGVTNPVTRDPAVTAAAIATVQLYSGGRAVLGIGRGDSAVAYLGLPPASVAAFARYVRDVRSYLRGEVVERSGFPSRLEWLPTATPEPATIAGTSPPTPAESATTSQATAAIISQATPTLTGQATTGGSGQGAGGGPGHAPPASSDQATDSGTGRRTAGGTGQGAGGGPGQATRASSDQVTADGTGQSASGGTGQAAAGTGQGAGGGTGQVAAGAGQPAGGSIGQAAAGGAGRAGGGAERGVGGGMAVVPVEVAATGPKVIAAAALVADRLAFTVGADPARVGWALQTARRAREEAGLDPDGISYGAYVNAVAHPDRAVAREIVRGSFSTLVRFSGMSEGGAEVTAPPDRDALRALARTYAIKDHAKRETGHAAALGEDFLDRFAVVGPSWHCAERLAALLELGLDRLIIAGHSRDADPALLTETAERFAAEVIPPLRIG